MLGIVASTRSVTSPAAGMPRRGREVRRIERRAGRRPHLPERFFDVRDRGTAQLDPRVAPRLDAARGIADPLAAHAKTAHEADFAVDGDQLAVVAREPAERAVEPRRVEAAHVAARLRRAAATAASRRRRGRRTSRGSRSTRTPARARSASAATNSRPTSSSATM